MKTSEFVLMRPMKRLRNANISVRFGERNRLRERDSPRKRVPVDIKNVLVVEDILPWSLGRERVLRERRSRERPLRGSKERAKGNVHL